MAVNIEYQVLGADEWLYPDDVVSPGASRAVSLAAARGARAACQTLFRPVARDAPISWEYSSTSSKSEWQVPELHQLIDVAVEKNTGPVGFVAREGDPVTEYAARVAPFRVYDATRPLGPDSRTRGEVEAWYACWRVPVEAEPGLYSGELSVQIGSQVCTIPVSLQVFAATIPATGTLAVTNWFSLENMATRHNLELWSEPHWAMIRRYGEIMRRGRQNHFRIPLSLHQIHKASEREYAFDFSRAERLIRLFLQLGFTCLEGGHVGTRVHFRDPEFVLTADRSIKATSAEGYLFLAQFLTAWRAFLERNGWLDSAIQYVGDEPIDQSAQDYRVLAGIVRKFLPGTPLVDAVERPGLGGAVDIWVPKNHYYQEHRDEFEVHRWLGDTLWFYTCCYPGGHFMNRLLDMPLIRTRLLHWGNYLYDLTGYLHWGFNQYRPEQDPFEEMSPAHGEGGTTNLPPGDTHIVYPGPEGPWGSVRLEAMASGVEDYELFRQLEQKDKSLSDEIVRSCLRSFDDADEDPVHFRTQHRRLLEAVST